MPIQSEPGPIVRQELTAPLPIDRHFGISGSNLLTLLSSLPLQTYRFTNEAITALLGSVVEEPLSRTLVADVDRVVVDLEMGGYNFVCMYFDRYAFELLESGNKRSPYYIEVELEYLLDGNKSSYERVRSLSLSLKTKLGLAPSVMSKYQQGIELLGSHANA